MNILLETRGEQDIFKLKGEIKVNLIPEISPQLAKYIQFNPGKNLVLDLSAVEFIDSSTLRMLINLHKRLEPQQKRLCLLSPSMPVKKIIEDVKLDTVFTIFSSNEELEQEATHLLRTAYSEFTEENAGLKKLICTCPVCGSNEVQGYLVDENAYDWSWQKDDLFPVCTTKDTKTPIDIFSLSPIVCPSCYMCSLNFAHFHAMSDVAADGALSGAEPAVAAQLSEVEKQHLSKTIKVRKKIMESCVVIGDNFFNYPRQKIATYFCLRLAESCAHSLAAAKMPAAPFWIGYINYLTIRYAEQSMKESLIGTIRTWMNKVVADKESYRAIETAKAYFILFAAAFSLEKTKEAAKILEEFSLFISTLPAPAGSRAPAPGFNSPLFWHGQAVRIGERLPAAVS